MERGERPFALPLAMLLYKDLIVQNYLYWRFCFIESFSGSIVRKVDLKSWPCVYARPCTIGTMNKGSGL